MGNIKPILAFMTFILASCTSTIPSFDKRVHETVPGYAYNINAKHLLESTDAANPLAYFYGVHYSTAGMGLSRPRNKEAVNILVSLLCQCLYNPDCNAHRDIIKELGMLGDRRAGPALIYALDKLKIPAAAEALGRIKDPKAVKSLIRAIKAEAADSEAVYALANIGTKPAIAYLCRLLLDPSSPDSYWGTEIRSEAAIAMGWLAKNPYRNTIVQALLEAFDKDPSIEVRVFCACALVTHGHDDKFDFLVNHMHDEDVIARRAVSECICFRLGLSDRTLPLIWQILKTEKDNEAWHPAWEELDKELYDFNARSHNNYEWFVDEFERLGRGRAWRGELK